MINRTYNGKKKVCWGGCTGKDQVTGVDCHCSIQYQHIPNIYIYILLYTKQNNNTQCTFIGFSKHSKMG